MKHPALQTERLTLRGLLLSDAAVVTRLAGDRKIAYNTLLIPHPYEQEVAERWIVERQVEFQKGSALTFAVILTKSREWCGAIGLGINRLHSHAELGYWIGVPFWNRGYCSEAASAVVDYGFEVLRLNRIWAAFFSRNHASGRVLEKVGMTHEGCLRGHILKWGEYLDVEQYGILRSEWERTQRSGSS
jgi:ribosomal-protein-alanine N-acetyltransferase